jgi:hypothetical protein
MKGKLFGLAVAVVAAAGIDLACCPHDAPPPQMGPPPVTVAPNWPSDETCFENALLWGEDGTMQAFTILIVAVPEPDRDRDQAAVDKAKKAVDTANAAFIDAVNAFAASKQGDLSGAKKAATAALTDLLALVQQIEGDVKARPVAAAALSGTAAPASNQEAVSRAQVKLDSANKDVEFLKKKSGG